VSSDVGAVSDQLKGHTRFCGVAGLLFAALLVVAMPLVKQSPGLNELGNVHANFYNVGILLFVAWFAFMSVLTRFRARTIQERSP
jgi:hypothetical protein